MLLKIIELIH